MEFDLAKQSRNRLKTRLCKEQGHLTEENLISPDRLKRKAGGVCAYVAYIALLMFRS